MKLKMDIVAYKRYNIQARDGRQMFNITLFMHLLKIDLKIVFINHKTE